jgi:hypothetical protein
MKYYKKGTKRHNMKKTKTKKRKLKGGGFMDYFTSASVNIPGLGSVGKCQSKQIYENGVWKEQKCYMSPFGPVYKTVENNAANNAVSTDTKPWYNFW